jgi:hypothetical protein
MNRKLCLEMFTKSLLSDHVFSIDGLPVVILAFGAAVIERRRLQTPKEVVPLT